jgi:uncharacterized protein
VSAFPTPSEVDRIAPTRRPPGRPLLRQSWRHLLFLHWPVPAADLRPLLPRGLEVDTHDGQAWVGLVPFVVTGSRPAWLPPVPGLSSFVEVNVRTYVHREGDPGVWFFSLDASSRLAVAAARAVYHLGYRLARMQAERNGEWMRFQSRRVAPGPLPATCAMAYAPRGAARSAPPATLDHFLLERYVLYAARGERLYKARVHHAPYPVQGADVEDLAEDLVTAAGLRRPPTPPIAHYAEGVDVGIFAIRALD